MQKRTALWTADEVESLNAQQRDRNFHQLTCGSGRWTDKDHLDGEGVLLATPNGWMCPFCDYRQDWFVPTSQEHAYTTCTAMPPITTESILAAMREFEKIPKPEFDCIVITEKDFLDLQAASHTPAAARGKIDQFSGIGFHVKPDGLAAKEFAMIQSWRGKNVLLVADGKCSIVRAIGLEMGFFV